MQELLQNGNTAVPDNAILTPSARDLLRGVNTGTSAVSSRPSAMSPASSEPIVPDYEYHWEPGKDPSTPQAIQTFFTSPPIETLKQRMVDIGRRMWERGYTDGNGGNLTIRVGDDMVLCTPTLVSKGFLKPEDMCLVDLQGKQLAGRLKRTSEVLTHLAIIRAQPKAKACCHAHPVHATAFAVAKVQPPTCLIPEAEVFLGQIAMAPYETPGTPAVAEAVGKAGADNMAVLMENHGVICWGKDVEDAYWRMENTESYCHVVWVASQLGKELTPFTGAQAKDLIAIRKTLGMDDKRAEWKECELCDNSEFRPGFVGDASASCGCEVGGENGGAKFNDDAEALVKTITEEILKQVGG